MKSLTTLQNYYVSLSTNSTPENITLGNQMINDTHRYLLEKYYNNERQYVVPGGTRTGVQAYAVPFNNFQVKDVTVKVGGLLYTPPEILTRQDWDQLNFIQYQSSYPIGVFFYNGQLLIFPIPSADGEPITFNYKIRVPDLVLQDVVAGTVSVTVNNVNTGNLVFGGTSGYTNALNVSTTGGTGTGCTVDILTSGGIVTSVIIKSGGHDYTVGDVLTITGGDGTATFVVSSLVDGSVITGSGTGWQITTGINEFRWITIPFPQGDTEWYQVKSVDSATQLTLVAPYTGLSAVSASGYTLGQVPLITEDFQDLLAYRPLMIYYSSINPDPIRRSQFESLYNAGIVRMDEFSGSKTTDVSLGGDTPIFNPNLFWMR
jgi:hypothetical protein